MHMPSQKWTVRDLEDACDCRPLDNKACSFKDTNGGPTTPLDNDAQSRDLKKTDGEKGSKPNGIVRNTRDAFVALDESNSRHSGKKEPENEPFGALHVTGRSEDEEVCMAGKTSGSESAALPLTTRFLS